MVTIGKCNKCDAVAEKMEKVVEINRRLREENELVLVENKNHQIRNQTCEDIIEELKQNETDLKDERDKLKYTLDHFNEGLKLINGTLYHILFANAFNSSLSIGEYGSVTFTLTPNCYRRSITVGQVKVTLYDSRDSPYEVQITKFTNDILNDIFASVMRELNLKYKTPDGTNVFEITTSTPLNSFFGALDKMFTETQTRYERLLEKLKTPDISECKAETKKET